MEQAIVYIGIDVAKAHLDVSWAVQCRHFSNERSGHVALVRWLKTSQAPIQLICEASGGYEQALLGMEVGHELIVITWLHEAKRDVLKGHPRSDESHPLTGVFYTRSPARPNPLGLHPVTVREIDGARVKVGPIEAFDGTPVVDIKSASTRADG